MAGENPPVSHHHDFHLNFPHQFGTQGSGAACMCGPPAYCPSDTRLGCCWGREGGIVLCEDGPENFLKYYAYGTAPTGMEFCAAYSTYPRPPAGQIIPHRACRKVALACRDSVPLLHCAAIIVPIHKGGGGGPLYQLASLRSPS